MQKTHFSKIYSLLFRVSPRKGPFQNRATRVVVEERESERERGRQRERKGDRERESESESESEREGERGRKTSRRSSTFGEVEHLK
jgi:hypothetical protein